jgi:hypothetical protein
LCDFKGIREVNVFSRSFTSGGTLVINALRNYLRSISSKTKLFCEEFKRSIECKLRCYNSLTVYDL